MACPTAATTHCPGGTRNIQGMINGCQSFNTHRKQVQKCINPASALSKQLQIPQATSSLASLCQPAASASSIHKQYCRTSCVVSYLANKLTAQHQHARVMAVHVQLQAVSNGTRMLHTCCTCFTDRTTIVATCSPKFH
jgi:hypothetical protein